MPQHPFAGPRGRLETFRVHSPALADNLLGDPAERQVAVYLPPGYDDTSEEYPLLVGLAGFTSSGLKLPAWRAFGESVPSRLDRLVAEGRMGPVVAAFPDCFTSLGGNQYVDSAALGRWETFLNEDLLAVLADRYRLRPGTARRAVFGRSSGGYGALVQGLRHGDAWGAVACHSGDIGFELAYARDFPAALNALAPFAGDPRGLLEHVRASPKISGSEMHALMTLAMAASYDPAPDRPYGVQLPVDPHTCERIAERWSRWLAHDPLTLVESSACQQSLRALRCLFVDCGSQDEYALHYGARRFARRLSELSIPHRYEEFADGHSGIDYRLDHSLPLLYEAIAGE